MRKYLLLMACMACSFVVAAPVAVIQAHDSVQPSERRFAEALAKHVERWYKEAGVPCMLSEDTHLSEALAGKKVAVLVYAALPTARQIQILNEFVAKDGKLIVCYSCSPALAKMMGVQVVGYQKGTTDGRWSQMRFTKEAPRGTPNMVLQTSSNIFLVNPISGQSTVLAWWHDRKGKQTSEPAWLASSRGYWMTHVLLADGDAEAKGRLLLALTAKVDPSLWSAAAGHSLKQARQICNTSGPSGLQEAAITVKDDNRRRRAAAAVNGALQAEAKALNLMEWKQYFEAWQVATELRSRMCDVYGLLQSPQKGEIRAVWDHSGMGLYPGDWSRTCRLLKDAGFSDLYVNVAGPGFAHYASSVLPRSRVFNEQGDQLAACVTAAKPFGLRVHAWLLCFSTTGTTQERLDAFHKRGWLLTNEDGSPRPWIDPGVPAARAYLIEAVREMAMNYKVAGIHLDFVRYPDFVSSLGPTVRSSFETFRKARVVSWPDDVKEGALRSVFMRWRTDNVSDFVQTARRTLKSEAQGKLLTAAVFGKYPSCVDSVGQDWELWLRLGLVDYVAPMNYTEDMTKFNEWLSMQTRSRKQAMKIISGIGVTAAESRLTPIEVIDQIKLSRKAGAAGFALFDLDTTLRQEVMPVLRLGITAP
ncbi:MAG: family 10 glycosylhydrolase [bacterium]